MKEETQDKLIIVFSLVLSFIFIIGTFVAGIRGGEKNGEQKYFAKYNRFSTYYAQHEGRLNDD